MHHIEEVIRSCSENSSSRFEFWIQFLSHIRVKNVAELGVLRGKFASALLKECCSIEKYYMIDPWRHLEGWNKPMNKNDEMFEDFLAETMASTDFAADKRIILRGKTTEVIDSIPDECLDFAYIDGDHTLKGISIDLIRLFPKMKDGGWIGGDDFSETIWQHSVSFEPTLVFPFVVYFAEAVGARLHALPHAQFLMQKNATGSFSFIDLTGKYGDPSLRSQLAPDYKPDSNLDTTA